jgi:hypothetical protein
LFAVLDRHLWNTAAGGSTGNTRRCCWPSCAAAPPRWVGIATAAPAADIRPPSPTTRAETDIALAARATRADAGSRRANGSFCPLTTSTRSLLSRANWLRSHYRTSGSSTTCCSMPALRPCLKSLVIHGISVPRSVSSVCFTVGTSDYSFIRISTAYFPPAVSLRIIPAGSPLGVPSFFPSAYSAASFAASSSPGSATPFIVASFSFTASFCR